METEALPEATVCHPIVDDRALLIEKQRGIGEGKIIGPGGKVEPGESPTECVIRETQEEIAATPTGVEKAGEFTFIHGDEAAFFIHVFRATGLSGTPAQTDEAIPHWFDTDSLPYDRMWADDRYWFPYLLNDTPFRGWFVFDTDGDELKEYTLDVDVDFSGAI
ncbi:8-oxo-dGTP diphosphatase [Natronocalculus amylovorans]|uniref:Oxidized purine nucleoside triphosphate hydrolase n=1 Tax=Natronocalculus amylovorans TaxID=2917812 RepID=A0AAE3K6P5_9EURY|nr:8-oxo-dGTP diphosphatase [Natronocalculus amylovorans]MCL9815442.1 8-oxo-dGTP diphosphatase [Natronocalculus amylovorans]NUE02044.1 8-oxo-dGTP diphosphatase [Halorubraceae archaeon YAN]